MTASRTDSLTFCIEGWPWSSAWPVAARWPGFRVPSTVRPHFILRRPVEPCITQRLGTCDMILKSKWPNLFSQNWGWIGPDRSWEQPRRIDYLDSPLVCAAECCRATGLGVWLWSRSLEDQRVLPQRWQETTKDRCTFLICLPWSMSLCCFASHRWYSQLANCVQECFRKSSTGLCQWGWL